MTAQALQAKDDRAVRFASKAPTPVLLDAGTGLPPLNTGLVDALFNLASGQTAADCPA